MKPWNYSIPVKSRIYRFIYQILKPTKYVFFLWFASLSFRLVLLLVFPYNFVKHNLELKMSSFFPLFTKYSSQSWQYISLEHHLLGVAMHFERSYQELWRKHEEIKRPKEGVVYDQFPFNHDITNETVRLRNKTSFLFYFVFV